MGEARSAFDRLVEDVTGGVSARWGAFVERLKEHDAETWTMLYQATDGSYYAIALTITRKKELAEDATQEFWVRACTKIGDLHSADSLFPWLHRIAVHCALAEAIRHCKEQPRMVSLDDLAEPPSAREPSPEDLMLFLSQSEQLKILAMNALTLRQREIFYRRYANGEAHDAIASALGIEVSTVRSVCTKVVTRLIQRAKELGWHR